MMMIIRATKGKQINIYMKDIGGNTKYYNLLERFKKTVYIFLVDIFERIMCPKCVALMITIEWIKYSFLRECVNFGNKSCVK